MIHGDVLGQRARLSPKKTALITVPDNQRFTYEELDQRAQRCAQLWQQRLDLRPGDRVGLLAHNRVEFVDSFFAASKSGIIIVPLGTRLTASELLGIIQDSGIRVLIYSAEFSEIIEALKAELSLDSWVALDDPVDAADARYDALFAALPEEPWIPIRPQPEDVHCLIYTSGTTGKPKGVMIPQRMVAFNGYNTAVNWQLTGDDISSIFTPLYHAGGLGAFLVPIFTAGGTIVLHHGFDAAEILKTIAAERCTVILAVPTILKMLLEHREFERVDVSCVRWFISGGAPLPQYLIDACKRASVPLKQGYGLTEVGVNCFSMSLEESVAKAGSIGKPMIFTEARLVDEQGRDVQRDQVGELLLRGPHVCKGYWNNPEATRSALDDEGWFHTGDTARQDDEGFYYIAGRKKEMFISGGVNVYPAEIEAALLLHPSVQDAAVVGVPHATWGEEGVAFVVPRPEQSLSDKEIAAHLEQRLARYKIPKRFVFVDEMPRTAYGKVQKHLLIQQHLEDR
jgi:fatty-acyl-CoA synthase